MCTMSCKVSIVCFTVFLEQMQNLSQIYLQLKIPNLSFPLRFKVIGPNFIFTRVFRVLSPTVSRETTRLMPLRLYIYIKMVQFHW